MQISQRKCDSCSKCCDGWLRGSAYGHHFYPGKPCHFSCNGCTIYADRPVDPCQIYQCEWLTNDEFPVWMRPDLCNVITTKRKKDTIEYYEICETGKKLDSAVLSWFVIWALSNQKNILYQLDGGFNRIGSNEFLQLTI